MEFLPANLNVNFVGKFKIWATLSGVLLVISYALIFGKGLNLGIDFTGGVELQVSFESTVSIDELRQTLDRVVAGASVQSLEVESGASFLARTPLRDGVDTNDEAERLKVELNKRFAEQVMTVDKVEVVGPQVGRELRMQGLLSVVYALIGILIYVAIRFEFKYAAGAVLAVIHDVSLLVGAFCFLGKEFNLPTIAAILAIIGYSLNDTVVVFDRVRENRNRNRRTPLAEVLNRSVNETLSRTVLTSLTLLLTVLPLLLLTQTGSMINDFALALMFGVVLGVYSTVFIASPIVLFWEKQQK